MVTSEVDDVNPRPFISHDGAAELFALVWNFFTSSHSFHHPFGVRPFLFGSQAFYAFGDTPSRLG